jgi:hypothetical protein
VVKISKKYSIFIVLSSEKSAFVFGALNKKKLVLENVTSTFFSFREIEGYDNPFD